MLGKLALFLNELGLKQWAMSSDGISLYSLIYSLELRQYIPIIRPSVFFQVQRMAPCLLFPSVMSVELHHCKAGIKQEENQACRELNRLNMDFQRIPPQANQRAPWKGPPFETHGGIFPEAHFQIDQHVYISSGSKLNPKKIANSRCCYWHKHIISYGLPSRSGAPQGIPDYSTSSDI